MKLMNKKGDAEDLIKSYIVYLILLVIFIVGMLFVVNGQRQGADVWADYYSKELVKVIDFAKEKDKMCLDVHKATKIAKDNEVESFSEIFQIDNINNDVCVKLSKGIKRCFNYFNDVDIVNLDLKTAVARNNEGEFVNVLCFDVKKTEVRDAA